uniref:CSON011230 protein n=1 Tax=Culicoides sonorensis TaxID=179676 RepID=A0A336KK74_CULSO
MFKVSLILVILLLNFIFAQITDPTSTTEVSPSSEAISSTTTIQITTPTLNVTQNPTIYCVTSGLIGKMLNPSDATCKTYVRCISQVNGNVIGMVYTCPGVTYFDDVTKMCGMTNNCV